ncbi:helix-turn-helix domain-containing protein [Actinopolymorpha rutila]|uniref:Transcriptional regulator with XRE-family HTH domain n=1 Tax=Actinopolymorpha rutila TaxID=446787 RepID=A0A852ZLG3_9ACTN|nr:helix-turn-helix domain-containing protein [Actinopolymorpha rutila]NYH92965.1 transcriptional regulator with XRE-family HTH domain [Actinopolymorpha rutila]
MAATVVTDPSPEGSTVAVSGNGTAVDVVGTWDGRRAKLLRLALRFSTEAFAVKLGVGARTVSKWESQPDIVPRSELQRALDTTLERATTHEQVRFGLFLAAEGNTSPEQTRPLHPKPSDATNELFATATRSTMLDAGRIGSRVGDDVIAYLFEYVHSLSRDYTERPLVEEFTDFQLIRDQALGLLDRTRRPSELADLQVVIGQSTAMMASIGFDLGRWDDAAMLARSATMYAENAGHASLEAWTLGLQGTLAFWAGKPEASVDHIERGLTRAPSGASRFRLRYIAARAHAVAGNSHAAAQMLQAAQRDREDAERADDPLQDGVGGEFAFDDGRAAACATSVWLAVNDGERVERAAEQALRLYARDAPDRSTASPVFGTRIDLAAGRLLMGDLAGAEAHLAPVLATPPSARMSLSGRMGTVRRLLSRPQWQRSAHAGELSSTVSDWLSAGHAEVS